MSKINTPSKEQKMDHVNRMGGAPIPIEMPHVDFKVPYFMVLGKTTSPFKKKK